MKNDSDAWVEYPHHRKWFDKLWVANLFKYDCGPCGVAPTKTDTYVIRPIYNLSGMGVGAHVKEIEAGDSTQVPAGYFWCEFIRGKHYSATYEFVHDINPYWKPISCWEGINLPINLTKFSRWERSSYIPEVPRELNELSDVGRINVEFKGDQVIEVHLRESPDPNYDYIVPVWSTDSKERIEHFLNHGYKYIESYEDADKQLENHRIGFLVR